MLPATTDWKPLAEQAVKDRDRLGGQRGRSPGPDRSGHPRPSRAGRPVRAGAGSGAQAQADPRGHPAAGRLLDGIHLPGQQQLGPPGDRRGDLLCRLDDDRQRRHPPPGRGDPAAGTAPH